MLVFLAVPAYSRPISETVFRRQKNPEQSFKPEMGRSTLRPPSTLGETRNKLTGKIEPSFM
jgi:hypothetical protein